MARISGLALAIASGASAFTPGSIDMTSYQDNGVVGKKIRTYADGLGRKIQEREEYQSQDIVVAFKRDNYGRIIQVTKPFMQTNGHTYSAADNFALANAYFNGTTTVVGDRTMLIPDAGGKAFSENIYYEDPLSRVKAHGEPGAAFSVASHPVKSWYLGRAVPDPLPPPLSDASLDAFSEANAKYKLSVSKDANGNYTQQITDLKGNILKTWADPSSAAGNEIVSQTKYDFEGRPIQSSPPGPNSQPDNEQLTYRYFSNTGDVLSEYTPDEGYVQKIHDRDGKLRFYKTAKDEADGYAQGYQIFHVIKYDVFGRETERGLVYHPSSSEGIFDDAHAANPGFPDPSLYYFDVKQTKYYDNADAIASDLALTSGLKGTLKNLKGKLVAERHYNSYSGDAVYDIYSYDGDGMVSINYKYLPGIPAQAIKYSYNLAGEVKTKVLQSVDANGAATTTSTWTYAYQNSRLLNVQKDGSLLVNYYQYPTGELNSRQYQKGGTAKGYQNIHYGIRNWPVRMESYNLAKTQLYREELYYESGTTTAPKFNGNVVRAVHAYKSPAQTESMDYGYDGVDRLTGAASSSAIYSEAFSYDAKGRFTKKVEKSTVYSPYEYHPNSNRVRRIGSPTKNNANGNYVYDDNGNMVIDRSKKISIVYDWRDMPSSVYYWATLPDRELTVQDVGYMDGAVMRAETVFVYDAAGKRVAKSTYRYN